MKIFSDSIQDGANIPARYAMKAVAGGANVSPQISLSEVPDKAQSLAVALVDRHPMARSWVHWLILNLPSDTTGLPEGASPDSLPQGGVEMINTFGKRGYGGPQPPRGSGVHRYELTAYALSGTLPATVRELSEREFLHLIQPMIVAQARITGNFENR